MRPVQPLPAVLVVDDTPSIRELLIHTLHDLVPYEIVAVTDATAALAVLAARPVPLLITDYHLTDMRGDGQSHVADDQGVADHRRCRVDRRGRVARRGSLPVKPFPLRELVAVFSTLLASNASAR
jgi:hypothetical protein